MKEQCPRGSKSCRPKPDTTANQAAGKINQPAGLASTGALPDPIRLRGDRQDKGDDGNHEDDGEAVHCGGGGFKTGADTRCCVLLSVRSPTLFFVGLYDKAANTQQFSGQPADQC